MNNMKAFKELIDKYNSLTLKEVKDAWHAEMNKYNLDTYKQLSYVERDEMAESLTGYGNAGTCILCNAVRDYKRVIQCSLCIYRVVTFSGCAGGNNRKTFANIKDAKTPKGMLSAYRNRANHITKLLKGATNE